MVFRRQGTDTTRYNWGSTWSKAVSPELRSGSPLCTLVFILTLICQWSKHTLRIQNIRNTCLIWSWTAFCPQDSLHMDSTRWLMLTPTLPTVVSSKLDVLCSGFVIHTGNCGAWETQQPCSSWHKPVHLAPTNPPRSKAHTVEVGSSHTLRLESLKLVHIHLGWSH